MARVQRGAAPLGRGVGVPADLDEAQHEQLHLDRQGRAPEQVVELVEVPDVELVVQRSREGDPDEVGHEERQEEELDCGGRAGVVAAERGVAPGRQFIIKFRLELCLGMIFLLQ